MAVEHCVLSGRGLCDGLITPKEKWCVCDRKASMLRRPSLTRGCWAIGRRKQWRHVTLVIDTLLQWNISIIRISVITHYDELWYGHAQWTVRANFCNCLQNGCDVVEFAASLRPDVPAIPNCSKTTRYVTIMEPSCNKITVVTVMKENFVFSHTVACSLWEIFIAPVKILSFTTFTKKNELCCIVTRAPCSLV